MNTTDPLAWLAEQRPEPALDEQALVTAERNLAEQIARPRETSSVLPRRRWRLAVVSATVAATVAVGVGVVNFGGRDATPRADAAVVRLLNTAAAQTPALASTPPGKYTHYRLRRTSTVADGSADGRNTWQQQERWDLWIPGTPDDEWVSVYRVTNRHFSSAAARAAAEKLDQQTHSVTDGDQVLRGPRSLIAENFKIYPESDSRYAGYPRDPKSLLTKLRGTASGDDRISGSADLSLLGAAGNVLADPLSPADLRRAVYRALALVPTLRVVDTVTFAGRKLDLVGSGEHRYTADDSPGQALLAFDDGSHELVGSAYPSANGGWDLDAQSWTVVDHAPTS